MSIESAFWQCCAINFTEFLIYFVIVILGDGGEDEKRDMLTEFIEDMSKDDKAIVFVGKKSKVDDIASDLSLKNIAVQSIHGDRDQSDREQALMDLKSGMVNILIATDVASRGIDIQVIISVFGSDGSRLKEFRFWEDFSQTLTMYLLDN